MKSISAILVGLTLSLSLPGCQAAAGEACNLNKDCQEALVCQENKCTEFTIADAACAAGDSCKQSGMCTLEPGDAGSWAGCQAVLAAQCEQSTNCLEKKTGCTLNAAKAMCE